jgi:oleate hydratase
VIVVTSNGAERCITVDGGDRVFLTLGSMTANSSIGSMDRPPAPATGAGSAAWDLWERIANGRPAFGKPSVFHSNIELSTWISFTLTLRDPLFLTLMKKFFDENPTDDGPVTLKHSPWLLTFGIPPQPNSLHQPKDVEVCWGYGLVPESEGTYIQKKMSACSGAEIFTELCGHLRLSEHLAALRATTTCIPCLMPFITSQFLPRAAGDRPPVIPAKTTNFAFLGQYCEIPGDIVFTIEYSIRSAEIAVNELLGLQKKPPHFYRGAWHPIVLWKAIRAVLR